MVDAGHCVVTGLLSYAWAVSLSVNCHIVCASLKEPRAFSNPQTAASSLLEIIRIAEDVQIKALAMKQVLP